MSVRTYNPSVRVGNWNEDVQLEEDTMKDFLERREKGELLIQKTGILKETVLKQTDLGISRDGCVHFGDVVMLVNVGSKDRTRESCALSINMSISDNNSQVGVTGAKKISPCARSAFVISSLDGTANGEPLRYEQPFYLQTASSGHFLFSDRATFQKSAKKSRHNEVMLVQEPSHLTEWMIKAFDPQYRLELENSPVPANQKIVFAHLKTNQNLHVEQGFTVRTQFGREFEISCFTDLDSHKAEKDSDHWIITMSVPGDDFKPVEAPPAGN